MIGTSLGAPPIVCAILLVFSSVGVALLLTVQNKRLINRLFFFLTVVSGFLCIANVFWPPTIENTVHICFSVAFAALSLVALAVRFFFKKLNIKTAFALICISILFGVLDLFF